MKRSDEFRRGARELSAAGERLDALSCADERDHDEDTDRKQNGLQDVRAGVVETEQDGERPAAGKGGAEHFGADQDRRADDSNDARPGDLAASRRRGLRAHGCEPVNSRSVPIFGPQSP